MDNNTIKTVPLGEPVTYTEEEFAIKKQLEYELEALSRDVDFAFKFNKLMVIMYRTAMLKGWHSPSKSFGEQILMMHSELSEIVEAYREENGNANQIWYRPTDDKPEGVPIEFADTIIRIFDTCTLEKINLFRAVIEKAQFNLTRPHRHGNKKL